MTLADLVAFGLFLSAVCILGLVLFADASGFSWRRARATSIRSGQTERARATSTQAVVSLPPARVNPAPTVSDSVSVDVVETTETYSSAGVPYQRRFLTEHWIDGRHFRVEHYYAYREGMWLLTQQQICEMRDVFGADPGRAPAALSARLADAPHEVGPAPVWRSRGAVYLQASAARAHRVKRCACLRSPRIAAQNPARSEGRGRMRPDNLPPLTLFAAACLITTGLAKRHELSWLVQFDQKWEPVHGEEFDKLERARKLLDMIVQHGDYTPLFSALYVEYKRHAEQMNMPVMPADQYVGVTLDYAARFGALHHTAEELGKLFDDRGQDQET